MSSVPSEADFVHLLEQLAAIRTPLNGLMATIGSLKVEGLVDVQKCYAQSARQAADALMKAITDIPDLSKTAANNIRVLIAEPELAQRTIVAEQLNTHYSPSSIVVDCGKLIDAMTSAIATGSPFAVVMLPFAGEIGFALRKAIAADATLNNAQFVAVLDSNDHASAAIAAEEGFAACLHRPFTASKIIDAVTQAMGVQQNQPAPSAAAPDDQLPASLEGLHLLVAEDNEMNQFVTQETLKRAGCTREIVADGAQAVDAFSTKKFDAILMDCQMPAMDGLEACRKIREIESVNRSRRMPIIALTAEAIAGDRERCLAAGMDGYVSKPIDADVLYAALANLVAKKADEPASILVAAPESMVATVIEEPAPVAPTAAEATAPTVVEEPIPPESIAVGPTVSAVNELAPSPLAAETTVAPVMIDEPAPSAVVTEAVPSAVPEPPTTTTVVIESAPSPLAAETTAAPVMIDEPAPSAVVTEAVPSAVPEPPTTTTVVIESAPSAVAAETTVAPVVIKEPAPSALVTEPAPPPITAPSGLFARKTVEPARPPSPVPIRSAPAVKTSHPPIDIDNLLSRCMQDADFARRTLEKFQTRVTTDIEKLQQITQQGDTAQIKRIANNLKAVSAHVAADSMRDIAFEIEQLSMAADLEKIVGQLKRLNDEAQRCAAFIPSAIEQLAHAGEKAKGK